MDKPRIPIQDWRLADAKPFWGVEGTVLIGFVPVHPKIPNYERSKNRVVRTSLILKINWKDRTCETENSIYELGDRDEGHELPKEIKYYEPIPPQR